MKNKRQVFTVFVLLFYMFTVLCFTVINRAAAFRGAQFEIFWSYKAWFAGNTELGLKIMANMAMFMPFGFLLAGLLSVPIKDRKKCIFLIIAAAALFSGFIETLQLVLIRGLFEWDDIISNTVGAVFGILCYWFVDKIFIDKREVIGTVIHVGFVLACVFIIIRRPYVDETEEIDTARVYCFQAEDVARNEATQKIEISGFVFLFNKEESKIELFLKSSETGTKLKLDTECGLPRRDVNGYFLCGIDYTNTGFTATVSAEKINPDEEYEVLIKWPWRMPISTGVYIRNDTICYMPENAVLPDATEGEHLKNILEKGIPLVCRPDQHCWVYQMGNCLYWIAGEGFNFEDDGTTYIQYQLTTTQHGNLPEKRLANGNYWDNIGGNFEKYELQGDFGSYRISRRELPTEYSIKSIVTGYYKNGEWVWKNYFRPVYTFG